MESANVTAPWAKLLILRWVNAFNARDLDGVLSCLHPDVDFRPLKLMGLNGPYRGHDGVRNWFTRLGDLHYAHCIDLSDVRSANKGQLLAIGDLSVAGHGAVAPFCALHRIGDELIIAARHYFGNPDRVAHLDLVS